MPTPWSQAVLPRFRAPALTGVTGWDLAQATAHRTLTGPIGQACRLVGHGLDRRRWASYASDVEYHEICRPLRCAGQAGRR